MRAFAACLRVPRAGFGRIYFLAGVFRRLFVGGAPAYAKAACDSEVWHFRFPDALRVSRFQSIFQFPHPSSNAPAPKVPFADSEFPNPTFPVSDSQFQIRRFRISRFRVRRFLVSESSVGLTRPELASAENFAGRQFRLIDSDFELGTCVLGHQFFQLGAPWNGGRD